MSLLDKILAARGLVGDSKKGFMSPRYDKLPDPFLLPDMNDAVERLLIAHKNQEKITIYGDYDIDGLTATTILLDAFSSFGFKNVETFMPNRFVEGYGLTIDAVERIVASGTKLVVTVDCGSLSVKEVGRANELGVDVIVTDHHTVGDILPPAVAVVNPKRADHAYPFIDLAGVGVAFKLVQALQTRLSGLPFGNEKWLLDLVALGTVCDVVTLLEENRVYVYYGLQVLGKTRRPGLRALMRVARIELDALNSRSLGFGLGPRMNAAGRLETAQIALDLLTAKDEEVALGLAETLDSMNYKRRKDQDKIMEEAILKADQQIDNPVLVVSSAGWNHGIVGIVAAKLLEKYHKPSFVLEEMGEESKGSARSYGDFSAIDGIHAAQDLIIKGGGHKLAAGITIKTKNIDAFRERINDFYESLEMSDQANQLLSTADAVTDDLSEIDEPLVIQLSALEPFGNGNQEPIIRTNNLLVRSIRKMGEKSQHVKIEAQDEKEKRMQLLAFNAPEEFFVEPGQRIDVWYCLSINEWMGARSIEGKLLRLESAKSKKKETTL